MPYDDDEKVSLSIKDMVSHFSPLSQVRLRGEVHRLVAPRDQKYQSNFVEVRSGIIVNHPVSADIGPQFRNYKIVYRRYAGLFFCLCVDANDNELAYLEAIHLFVEILGKLTVSPLPWHHLTFPSFIDTFFDNVCELDLVFNFYKVGDSIQLCKTISEECRSTRF